MRKIVTGAFLSLDGVMQAPGAPEEDPSNGFKYGGWLVPLWDEACEAAMRELFAPPFELLLGRTTYDIFSAHWPNVEKDANAKPSNEQDLEIARRFNSTTKHVATHRPESLRWQNSRALGTDVVASLRELKKQDGPTLLTQGSSLLVQTLLANDLIDELRLITFPVALGCGKRLFGEGTQPGAFSVTKSVLAPRGAVIATYQRAGSVTTGSFALSDSSPKK
jgi:dihydrofolate reductase